jgi:hypothetical protein
MSILLSKKSAGSILIGSLILLVLSEWNAALAMTKAQCQLALGQCRTSPLCRSSNAAMRRNCQTRCYNGFLSCMKQVPTKQQ